MSVNEIFSCLQTSVMVFHNFKNITHIPEHFNGKHTDKDTGSRIQKKKAQVDFHTGIVDFTSEKVKVQSPSHVMLYIHSKCIKKCNLKAYVH